MGVRRWKCSSETERVSSVLKVLSSVFSTKTTGKHIWNWGYSPGQGPLILVKKRKGATFQYEGTVGSKRQAGKRYG